MACFLVPTAEAVVVTVIDKMTAKKKSKEAEVSAADIELGVSSQNSFRDKVKWLENMLWGGSALLAFEHVWHGEVVPWFPFLTAAQDPAEFAEMLKEMATVGVGMSVAVTVVWGLMAACAEVTERRLTERRRV